MKRWLGKPREYWDVGEDVPFRPSKDRSQRFLEALIRCDGKIHDIFSLDVHDGEIRHNQKIGQIAVLHRISLPEGAEDLFRQIMGEDLLTPPPEIHLNHPRVGSKPDRPRTGPALIGDAMVRSYYLHPHRRTMDHPDGKVTSGEWRELDPALFSNDPGPALDRLMLERRKAAEGNR